MTHDAERVADLLTRANDDPSCRDLHTHGTPREVMLAGLRDALVVLHDDAALALDVAPEKGRAWGWGPAVEGSDRARRADALLDEALTRLPGEARRISFFPAVGAWMVDWLLARGAKPGNLVHVYRTDRRPDPTDARSATAEDLAWLRPLHHAAFPGTYLDADELLAARDTRRTLVVDKGYVTVEVQDDGTGYVHFLAVDPGLRRRGLGCRLLDAGVGWLFDRGVPAVFLTVHDDNDARQLYARAGFTCVSTGQPLDLYLDAATPAGPSEA